MSTAMAYRLLSRLTRLRQSESALLNHASRLITQTMYVSASTQEIQQTPVEEPCAR